MVTSILSILGVFALLIAGLMIYSAFKNHQTAEQFPPLGKFVEVEGVKLHYVEMGEVSDKPSIVLLHGASGNLRDFHISLMPKLAESHHVIAFDRPGHGWSERPDREDIIDPAIQADVIKQALGALNIDKPVLLGHSWSGGLVTAYALAHPEALSGVLVLAGATHAWQGGVSWYHDVVATPVLGEIFMRSLLVPAASVLAPQGVVGNFAPDPAPEGYAEAIGLDLLFRPHNFRNNSADVRRFKSFLGAQSDRYGDIAVPMIIITGNRDQTVLAKIHSYALHEQVAGSEMIKLQGTGHMPHHVHEPIVLDALTRLANGDTPRAGTHIISPQRAMVE